MPIDHETSTKPNYSIIKTLKIVYMSKNNNIQYIQIQTLLVVKRHTITI